MTTPSKSETFKVVGIRKFKIRQLRRRICVTLENIANRPLYYCMSKATQQNIIVEQRLKIRYNLVDKTNFGPWI